MGDFVWTEIEVFWLPLRGYDKEDRYGTSANSNDNHKKKKKKKKNLSSKNRATNTLKAARPPDSYGGVVSEWRWCHMGLILVANQSSKNEEEDDKSYGDINDDKKENVQVCVLLDLHNSGVRIHRVFAEAKKSKAKIYNFVQDLCAKDGDVSLYSAGVTETIDPKVQSLE